jgi:hypothetical protein
MMEKYRTMTVFVNPANGYSEVIKEAWLWSLLFGSFYFAAKGVWGHAIISLALALATGGIAWLIYPFFATEILRKHYLRKGWSERGY